MQFYENYANQKKLVAPSAQYQEGGAWRDYTTAGRFLFREKYEKQHFSWIRAPHITGIALGGQMGVARRFLHLRTFPPSQPLWFSSISDSIGYDLSYWDYGSSLTLPIHEFIHIFL